MSTQGRGRGYSGRHHLRSPRPGDADAGELEAARTLAELSPRSTEPAREYKEPREADVREEGAGDTRADRGEPRGDRGETRADRGEPRGDRGELRADRGQPRGDRGETRADRGEPRGDRGEPRGEREETHGDRGDSDDAALAELLTVDEQYAPLLALLEQFSPGEDGIQFNRKLRHFETTVTNMCPDEARLQQAFSSFRAASLARAGTARRLAAVGASFTRQQRQQLLRAALLNVVMQGTFAKLDVLERANPVHLINAANLMGDYFAEARLCNGNKVHILASPLLQYLKALLASDDLRAHRSLATQLMQNGRELLLVLAQELDELSISIRLRLLAPPPVSVVWLLLAADLCLNKFLPLPASLQQFYAAHLDLATDDAYSEVTYGAWKNDERDDKLPHNLSQVSLNHSDDSKPKLRPILGAGAGLLRQEQSVTATQDNYDTWATRNSLSKRYDLNSWRQADEEKKDDSEPTFNPNVMPPSYPVVPNYPPPVQYNYQETMANYLQQGDGAYIQNQYNNVNYNQEPFFPERTALAGERADRAERVSGELQKSARRPAENWRKDKDDANRNRRRSWTRLDDDDERPCDVPRHHNYWDHDDRCDKDYSS